MEAKSATFVEQLEVLTPQYEAAKGSLIQQKRAAREVNVRTVYLILFFSSVLLVWFTNNTSLFVLKLVTIFLYLFKFVIIIILRPFSQRSQGGSAPYFSNAKVSYLTRLLYSTLLVSCLAQQFFARLA